jgi:Di-haem oxidoreductase, putative peroxidase
MSTRRILAIIFILSIWTQTANAGPANRTTNHNQPNVPVNLSGFGAPLPAVAKVSSDLNIFATGQINFKEVETLPQVGPIMNGVSCAGCHSQPAIGGGGLFINEIRVRNNTQPGPVHIFAVDNFLRNGPQTQGSTPIFAQGIEGEPLGCQITVPGCQLSACQEQEETRTTFNTNLRTCDPTSAVFQAGGNCVVGRSALPLFGDGLVEAVADNTFVSIAQSEPPQTRGIVKMVAENFTSVAHVGRFGWKDDHASLRGFSGDAYLNEMGITNPDNQNEVSECATNEAAYGIPLQDTGVEDPTGPDGRADIDRFSDFARALAPPPRLTRSSSAQNGANLFSSMGCANCHTASITTASNPASFIFATTGGAPISQTLSRALANQTFNPYSDFLLHDMGSLGDGITSGAAGPTMLRTAPLWGLRANSVFLHDGRASDIPTAINLHDGQGRSAAQAFGALNAQQQQDVVKFIETL